jgi:hypothetical protein
MGTLHSPKDQQNGSDERFGEEIAMPIFTYGITYVGRGRRDAKSVNKPTQLVAGPLTAEDLRKMDSNALRWHELNNRANLDATIEAANKSEKQFERQDLRVTNATTGASREQGERKGYSVRELTYREIQEMTADETAFHQRFNADNWRKALEAEAQRRDSRKHIAATRVNLMYQGHATPDEDAAAIRAGQEFVAKTPTFERTQANAFAMYNFMRDAGLDATDVRSYFQAFHSLVERGDIKLPKILSADEFLEQTDVLKDHRVPPLVQARTAKADATREHFENAANNTAHAGSTHFTNYLDEQSGYPPAPTKYSFRKLLDSLSSDEFQKRLNEDSAFRAACDRLNKKTPRPGTLESA